MTLTARRTVFYAALLLGLMAWIGLPRPAECDELETWRVATNAELNEIRGGFITEDGLQISFGIQRAIYVNGVLDTASTFNVHQVDGVLSSQSPSSAAGNDNMVRLVQLGPPGSNSFTPAGNGSSILPNLTVIQNSLDKQVIQNMTQINASVTNLQLFRDMNMASLISRQMIGAIR